MARLINQLIECGVQPNIARRFADPLAATMQLHAIDSALRQAGYLANAYVESEGFTKLEEGLWYTTPERVKAVFSSSVKTIEHATQLCRNPKLLANTVYANKLGNGSMASGDGWKYRGRGIFQLTGKFNYHKASIGTQMGAVYLNNPDLVSETEDACITAAWFWVEHKCNHMMDAQKFDSTIKAINPPMLHAKQRRAKFSEFLKVLA